MGDVMVLEHMTEETMKRLRMYHGQKPENNPKYKRLIGHIERPDYVCPSDDRWIHDDSDSECGDGACGKDGGEGGDGGTGGDVGEAHANDAFRKRKGKAKVSDKPTKTRKRTSDSVEIGDFILR